MANTFMCRLIYVPPDLSDPTARRRFLLSLARRRARPGAGSLPEFLQTRTWRQPVFDLRAILSVPFVVVGGVAARLYAPGRQTADVNILVVDRDAGRLSHHLLAAGAVKQGDLTVGGSAWRLPGGTVLDVLTSGEAWAGEPVGSAVPGPDGLPIASLPFLVLMKMISSRAIDVADVSRLLGAADEQSLQGVRAVIGRLLSDASEDVESLLLVGRLELGA